MGGANLIDKVPDPIIKIGTDNNKYLIAMFNEIKCGWTPPDSVSEEEYKKIKDNKEDFPPALVGFVGIACSFAGKWFGGYARGGKRNYCLESKKNILKQAEKLKNVDFFISDYEKILELNIGQKRNEVLIYCDPPYQGTTKYSSTFDSKRFWGLCDTMAERGYRVYVSEYQAPEDWHCIWEKKIVSSLDLDTGSKTAVEKLFTKTIHWE